MGMYLRMVLSLLIDGDWTDTACFSRCSVIKISLEETQKIWNECIEKFEQYMSKEIHNNPSNGNVLNTFRQEISVCVDKLQTKNKIFIDLLYRQEQEKHLAVCALLCIMRKRRKTTHYLYSTI